jgi:hypothetical protein
MLEQKYFLRIIIGLWRAGADKVRQSKPFLPKTNFERNCKWHVLFLSSKTCFSCEIFFVTLTTYLILLYLGMEFKLSLNKNNKHWTNQKCTLFELSFNLYFYPKQQLVFLPKQPFCKPNYLWHAVLSRTKNLRKKIVLSPLLFAEFENGQKSFTTSKNLKHVHRNFC